MCVCLQNTKFLILGHVNLCNGFLIKCTKQLNVISCVHSVYKVMKVNTQPTAEVVFVCWSISFLSRLILNGFYWNMELVLQTKTCPETLNLIHFLYIINTLHEAKSGFTLVWKKIIVKIFSGQHKHYCFMFKVNIFILLST